MTGEERELFSYEFIPNIDVYEPKLMLGLTFMELTAAGMALIFPLMLLQSIAGIVLGGLAAILTILLLKRFALFGNLSLPIYLFKRALIARRKEQIQLAHLMPAIRAEVQIRDYNDEHIATYQ